MQVFCEAERRSGCTTQSAVDLPIRSTDVKGARTLVFKNRKGALAQERHNAEIVHFMWKLHELDGLTVEKAAEVVHKDWKVGERWARNLWYERPDLRPTRPL